MAIERRQINSTATSGNGSGAITVDSPLPDRLREQERRISAALTDDRSASDLADLLQQTDWAVISAEEFAQLENEKALDVLQSPDPTEAMRSASSAAFLANRLRAMRPRLLARLQQVTQREELEAYRMKMAALAPERNALEQELADTYQEAANKLVNLFARVRAFQQRAQQALGDPPPGVSVLPALGGTRVLDACVLPDFAHPDRNAWPLPSAFAATFAQSMAVPPHPGAAWCDPDYQERQRAEREAEQQRNAAYHEQSAREQEARQNKEERERFLARQRA